VKARFEEKLLAQKYPDYAAYSAKVGRLLPLLGRKR
jgi:protein-S-isoprenylcysteine O-methyltransferase Ste14